MTPLAHKRMHRQCACKPTKFRCIGCSGQGAQSLAWHQGSLPAELAASPRSLSSYSLFHTPGTNEAQNMTGVMSASSGKSGQDGDLELLEASSSMVTLPLPGPGNASPQQPSLC